MNPNNREPIFRALVNNQNKIGWKHLLKGCFSNQWIQIQGRHILDDPEIDQEKQSRDRWFRLILHHLWTHLRQLRLACNNDLHGHKKDKKECKGLEKLQPRVLTLYSKVDLLLACNNKPSFEIPIQEQMKLHIVKQELETWVELITPTVKRALADAQLSTFATPITSCQTRPTDDQ